MCVDGERFIVAKKGRGEIKPIAEYELKEYLSHPPHDGGRGGFLHKDPFGGVRRKPERKAPSRRTEMAYKAQSPGKLAQHNEAQGSGDLPARGVCPELWPPAQGSLVKGGTHR